MKIKNYKQIASTKPRQDALDVLEAGLNFCNPENFIKENVFLTKKNILHIKNKKYDLNKYKDVYLIGFGKMSASVASIIENIIPIKKGVIIDTEVRKLKKVRVLQGTHPFPSVTNVTSTVEVINVVQNLKKDDLVICIVSGGGSALLCYPTLEFDQYLKELKKVFFFGGDIRKLNNFRKSCSKVKGGKLAKMIRPAKLVNLYFSDVIGDDFRVIASAPTFSIFADNILMLNNEKAIKAMVKRAKELKLHPIVYSSRLSGEAKYVGKKLLEKVKGKNVCLIASGETTVKVKNSGKGGRNQELALGALSTMKDIDNCALASIDSDGIDGVTDAAGAIIDKATYEKAHRLRLDIGKHLHYNSSNLFFKKTKDLVMTGKTGINVMDFVVVVKR